MAQPTDLGTVLDAGVDELFSGSRSSLPSTLVMKTGQLLYDVDASKLYAGDGRTDLSSLEVLGSSDFASLNPLPASYTYNIDGTVATETIGGVPTVYTYVSGVITTSTRFGVTRTYNYNSDGTIASIV